MYNDLKKLKSIKGLTDAVKRKIEKAWTWGADFGRAVRGVDGDAEGERGCCGWGWF